MRALLVLLWLSTVAEADERAEVFGANRERALDALVAKQQLSPAWRVKFPTKQVAARELARLRTNTARPLDPERCVLTAGIGDLVFQCGQRGCGPGCMVTEHVATIRVRGTAWSVIATGLKRLGDTGECGCCM